MVWSEQVREVWGRSTPCLKFPLLLERPSLRILTHINRYCNVGAEGKMVLNAFFLCLKTLGIGKEHSWVWPREDNNNKCSVLKNLGYPCLVSSLLEAWESDSVLISSATLNYSSCDLVQTFDASSLFSNSCPLDCLLKVREKRQEKETSNVNWICLKK